MLVEVLAVLSAAAAAGMRIGLPLLMVGVIQGNSWESVPVLSIFPFSVVTVVLTSWSLVELLGSKRFLGQRMIQLVQLIGSPFVGVLMAMTVLKNMNSSWQLQWILAGLGGLLALFLTLVQIGWFFRLQRLPLWFVFGEDILCVILVVYAFEAPINGGLIAIMLLWLAVRSSSAWYRWQQENPKDRG